MASAPIAKIVCGLAFATLLGFAAFVADGASARVSAGLLSQPVGSPSTDAARRARATQVLEHAWSQPLRWNADAASLAGWMALTAPQPDPQQAAHAFEQTVRIAPLNAQAWLHLSELAPEAATPLCPDPKDCAARSLSSAPMGRYRQPDFLCAQVRRATQTGLIVSADDPYVRRLRDAGFRTIPQLSQCLSGLPPRELYLALVAQDPASR